MPPKVVYTDVDGTLVGPRGSFFRAPDDTVTLEPARALAALHQAGVALVLVSGRTRPQLFEASLLLGADGFIAELGALVGWTAGRGIEVQPLPAAGPPADAALVADLGAAFELRPYEPWSEGHEVDVLLRGRADPAEVEAWLAAHGADHLRLRDNGLAGRGDHVFHLIPDGIGKAQAVAWDLSRRGVAAPDAVAVGDSLADLEMAAEVGHCFLVANALAHPGVTRERLPGNATVTGGAMGLGWAEAVHAVLSGRP